MKKNSKEDRVKHVYKSNYRRVLLTEVLPYEIPILLTNEGFYLRPENHQETGLLGAILKPRKETYPFIYKIVRAASSYRTLHLIHPSSQQDFVDFYKNYSNLICGLTARSEFTLRAPSEVASSYYESANFLRDNSIKDEGAETNVDDAMAVQFKYASSFFLYKKYAFLYKFYDSYEFHRLEKKFKKLLKFDISKCFDNISTKRLGEAVKDEIYHKEHFGKRNFENIFSNLMESANFGRNDGLVIGPEFSRIFAEIILQDIDKRVYQANLNLLSDYDVRRYVDDYFLFFNDDKIGEHILSEFQNSLEKVKLYLNESKISRHKVPFLTGITMAKKDIQDIFSVLFDTFDESKKGIKPDIDVVEETDSHSDQPEEKITFIKFFKGPGIVANRLIRDIKAIVKSNEIEFESITGYFFTVIKNKIYEIYGYSKNLDDSQQENVLKFLLVIVDVTFFVYSMDIRVRNTFLVSQISIICSRIAKLMKPVYGDEIIKKVQDEIIFIMKNKRADKIASGVEVINLLIALREISGDTDLISEEDISKFIFNETLEKISTANYFQLISIIFYIKNNKAYEKIKQKLKMVILEILSTQRASVYSEASHLLLDLVRCPYLDRTFKAKMITNSFQTEFGRKPTSKEVKREYNRISFHDWFVDWSETGIKIERLLQKKELKTAYE
ncbi:antiviral reverse transcriptase Drt3b [Pectobacterium aroidearum]|uniref:antiviral reverse transcriptase Drt3b n=1 Tax=Pectobacterium aroidearum TaxID=1201031 RepID=UPI00211588F9|nr:antiviral reverse transcriptase Drt3b [Pectobacterium aroidearum]UUE46228.1 RNA-directed DNA polymerase [Pectobacterium aroidearum]UUE50449.1 RNA-directed DNA polymerase [Pectobacterium aroidearum]UUE54654.1 RNA-directed DNA polymerase [Pectobacterium aroidearum]UUE63062.1 RNA-directed DNA polymerase [Pectobacterium aroidearum]UUE67286.1 RNA-directed DNA polymerase [Pectobacterium aroidearum]